MSQLDIPPLDLLTEVSLGIDEMRDEPELRIYGDSPASADQRLAQVEQLRQIRFDLSVNDKIHGPAQRQLLDDLWLYGWHVVRALIRTNRMTRVLREYAPQRRVMIAPEDLVVLAHSSEEREALALDVICDAVRVFTKNVINKGQWTPDGGASLRTWFIGTCALVFPRAYQKWSRSFGGRLDRIARQQNVDWTKMADVLASNVAEPSTFALDRAVLRSMFAGAQPMTILIFSMLAQDLTTVDIARQLGVTTRTVEGRIYRFRQRARQRQHQANERRIMINVGSVG